MLQNSQNIMMINSHLLRKKTIETIIVNLKKEDIYLLMKEKRVRGLLIN